MSATTSSKSQKLSREQMESVQEYVEDALSTLSRYPDASAWARSYARNYYHSIDNQIGFLPVYHTLLKAAAAAPKDNAHPLLPTPQNQSESFEVKMDKLFKYAWPLVGEYRSLDRWAKVQAAQWMTKGNISHKLSQVIAKLLEMADAKQKASAPKPSLTYEDDFDHMADAALGDVKHFDSPESWARATARNFYHQFGKATPFITIYGALLRKNEEVEDNESESESESEYEEDEDYETEDETESEDDDEDYETEEDDDDVSCSSEESDTLIVKDGKQTKSGSRSSDAATRPHPSTKDEEAEQGRLILNRILFKEYSEWYEAFEQEAEEDDQDLSAEDRFSWHCAKILSRKTDIPREDCQPIVGAWLQLHKEHLTV